MDKDLLPAARPPIKWNGGKSYRLAEIGALLEGRDWSRWLYFEPMFGGGASFWAFGHRFGRRAIADACPELVNLYRVLRDAPGALVDALRGPEMWYRGIGDQASKDHYYAMRGRYGEGSAVERAATFMFLNRCAINGLHRVSGAGRFNSGAGSYVDPNFCDEPLLRACSAALQGAPIVCRGVAQTIGWVGEGGRRRVLLFVDPPYQGGGYTGYAGGFSDADQAALVAVLLAAGRPFIYTNADTPSIRSLFAGSGARLASLPLRHKVGPAKARGRSGAELLAHNL